MSNFQEVDRNLHGVGQTTAMWVDVYDACNFTGNRRRFFAPTRIERSMWDDRTCSAADPSGAALTTSISVRLGNAGVRLRVRRVDGVATDLATDAPAIDLNDAISIEIVAPAAHSTAAA